MIESFIKELNDMFALKDLGELDYFLGIKSIRNDEGMYLTQTKYINDLLERLNLSNLKPCGTPATVGKSLLIYEGEPMENPTIYRSVVGALQ